MFKKMIKRSIQFNAGKLKIYMGGKACEKKTQYFLKSRLVTAFYSKVGLLLSFSWNTLDMASSICIEEGIN